MVTGVQTCLPIFVQSKKYHAHTDAQYNEGDIVEIQEGRPVSKTKSWYVSRLLTAAKVV